MSPSAPKRAPRVSFYEILIEGSSDRVQGFVAGLQAGSGAEARFFLAGPSGVRTPLGEKVLGMIHLSSSVCHLIADSDGRSLIRKAVKNLEAAGMRIAAEKRIRTGAFEFRYHAYARQYAQEIRELLSGLPDGIKVQAEKPVEKIEEGARGVEAYSPAHHYEIEGSGTVSGARIDRVIEARRKLVSHPLVEAELIELTFA